MTCRSCGAQIAANALICYKCGTATTEPRIQPPGGRVLGKPRRSRGLVAALVAAGLAAAAVAAQQAGCVSLL
jgi:hypothetical protein